MKMFTVSVLICIVVFIGCKKNNATEPASTNELGDYLPIQTGHTWTYTESADNNAEQNRAITISVLATNTLVGGNPNAFIVQEKEVDTTQTIACSVVGKTLMMYRGASDLSLLPEYLYWNSGSVTGVTVAPNRTNVYSVVQNSSLDKIPVTILRSTDGAVASASVTGGYTVNITGNAAGSTSFTLRRTDGTATDTMRVLVVVAANSGRAVAPPLTSWIPLWQRAGSSGATLISWDTVYSFRLIGDSTLCTDHINYNVTCRFVDIEQVQALGSILQAEKYITNITVTESIVNNGFMVFNGLSTNYAVTLWIVKGIGFVKGSFAGSSLTSGVVVDGVYDSSGMLHGAFVSPRIIYISLETVNGSSGRYFHVNTTPLDTAGHLQTAVLTEKNF